MNKVPSRELLVFIGITFLMSMGYAIVWSFEVLPGSIIPFFRIGAMLIPAIGVIAMTWVFKAKVKEVGWKRFPLKWLLPALFMLPVVIHMINLPLVAFLNQMVIPWQDWLTPDSNGIFQTPEHRGWGEIGLGKLIERILTNAIVGLLIVSVLTFFEEIGWRSWMLPRLINKYGITIGILSSAIIWSVWHIPFVLGGINRIPGIPIIPMMVLYPLGLVGAGIIIGWLWHQSRSIWIVCLAHGSFNNWGQYAFKYMKGEANPEAWPWLYTGVNASLLLIGVIVLVKISSNEKSINQKSNVSK